MTYQVNDLHIISRVASRYVKSWGEDFDLFDTPAEDTKESPIQALEKRLGEYGSMLDASKLLKPSGVSECQDKAIRHYRRSRAWAVKSNAKTKAEAERIGKKLQANLIGKNSLDASQVFLHHLTLYVTYEDGFVEVDPLPEVARDTSKSDLKFQILREAKEIFGNRGVSLSGHEGAYELKLLPYAAKLRGKFRETTIRAKTLEEIQEHLKRAIELVSRL